MKYLAIGPGAMGYFAFLGTMSTLKQTGRLDDLEEISGASAGALLAFVFALAKGDTTKVLDYTLTVNTKQIMKPNIKSFLKDYGLVSSAKLRDVFSGTVRYFTGTKDDMTFKELYEWYPIKLHVSSYCLDALKTVYFSVDSTPSMSVLDAISASIAIPFVISPVKLNDGWSYIDGGYAESTPCGAFLGRSKEDILVLALDWKLINEIKDLKSYAIVILTAQMRIRYDYDYPTLRLKTDINVFDFGANQETKLKLFMDGTAAVH